MQADTGGLRQDEGKAEYHLLPADGLYELARVYTAGAKKYTPRNWERGMKWSRCYNSLCRHLAAFWGGERDDAESGLHHMAHVTWNAMALLVYSMRGIGEDDRTPSALNPAVRYQGLMSPHIAAKKYALISDLTSDLVREPPPIVPVIGMTFSPSQNSPVWRVKELAQAGTEYFMAECVSHPELADQYMHPRAIVHLPARYAE